MHKKAFLGLLTDTFDLPQSTLDLGFAPEAAVEGDAEAVGFVTDLHQDFQRPGVTVQEQRVRVVHPDHEFHTLGKADDHQPVHQSEFGQSLAGELQLAFSAIDHHQLRQVVRSLHEHTGVTAVDHLLHRSEVIGPDDRLDLELTVILLGRHSVTENHTGSHRIGSLDVGVVEALDVGRKLLHSQGLAQVLKNHPAIFVRIGVLPLLDGVEKIFLGILDA